MNNFKYLFLFVFLFVSCKGNKEIVKIFQSNENVILRYNPKYNYVYRINLPVEIDLINNFPSEKTFLTINFNYNPYSKGLGEDLYDFNYLKKIKNNKKKYISPFKKKKIVLYTWYKLDSSRFIQQQLKPYVTEMLAKNKDTLHVGTVSEFKQKHKELFEKLTKNDSISVQFLDNGKLGERITVPVKW